MATPAIGNFWSAARPVWLGLISVLVLFLGLGLWGSFTKISGAIIASGMIQVESFRQVVQHPEGGVVGEINVGDGDIVEAGEILIRFDDTLLNSKIVTMQGQHYEMLAQKGRLEAEREAAQTIEFDIRLQRAALDQANVQDLLLGQQRLFNSRISTMQKEIEQLEGRKSQVLNQIEGFTAQLDALQTQIELIAEELKDQQTLLDRGLAQASRVLSLRREEARLKGQVGDLTASSASAAGQAIEIDIEILKLPSQRQEEAMNELRDLQFREIELYERLISSQETLSRLEVRAPMSGIVYGLQVHALRAVVRPADPILQIVPSDSPLVIASRIEAIHIDQVHVGQDATMHFSTFDQRTTPVLFGTVTVVSADVFTDEQTGMSYYTAEIMPKEGELEKLSDLVLLPGMPVEAFIKTDERTPLSFLVKPFTDYFNRAFRES